MSAVLVVVFCLKAQCTVEEIQTKASLHTCNVIAPQVIAQHEQAWPQYRGYAIKEWRCEIGRGS